MKKKRCNLVNIIYDDLCIHGKLNLLLLTLVMLTAILTIMITYKTRCMIIDREELSLEIDSLNYEWNNLVLNEKILSSDVRIERIAEDQLQMGYVDPVLKKSIFK